MYSCSHDCFHAPYHELLTRNSTALSAWLYRHALMRHARPLTVIAIPTDSVHRVHHKVHIYKEYHNICPIVGIGTLSPPSFASQCSPPQEPKGGVHTRLRVRGWGSPNSDDWRKGLVLRLLYGAHCPLVQSTYHYALVIK